MARPVCGNCGKPYGQRELKNECVAVRIGAERPRYTGNRIVVKETTFGNSDGLRGASGTWMGVRFGPNETILIRSTWDGETWHGGYVPFCTLRCALDYAREAYTHRR